MGWRRFFRRHFWDRERSRELESYIEMETDENIARGMLPTEARAAALRKLGNRAQIREDIYRMNTIGIVDTVWRELRDAVRTVARQPASTGAVVLTLALGIGANTAVFGVVDRLMIRDLPVARPDTLVRLAEVRAETGGLVEEFTYPVYDQLRRNSQRLTVFMASVPLRPAEITEQGEYREATVQLVSDNYFEALGLEPALGRFFPEDSEATGETVAVISDRYWQQHYAKDPAAVGERFRYLDREFTIIGIAPELFDGTDIDVPTEIWVPFEATIAPADASRERGRWLHVMGRLQPDTAPDTAQAEANALLDARVVLRAAATGYSELRGRLARPLVLLEVVVVLIVLLACANLANLGLADLAAREGEMAVRRALGGSGLRLASPLLFRSSVLAMAGGTASVVVARWMTVGLLGFLPSDQVPANLQFTFDTRLLGSTFLLSMVTSLLIGLGPSLSATRPPSRYRRPSRMGRTLVAGSMAACSFLLVVAGLFVSSVQNLRSQDAGYQEDGLLVADVRFPRAYPEARRDQAIEELRRRVVGLAGVQTAAFSHVGPLTGAAIEYDVQTVDHIRTRSAFEQRVSPGFFAAVGNRLVVGRDFTDTDDDQAPPVAIVNLSFLRILGLEDDPVGQSFLRQRGDDVDMLTIVGVVTDVKWLNLRDPSSAMYYLPYRQKAGSPAVRFAVRATGEPDALARQFLSTARTVDAQMIVENVGPFSRVVDASLMRERLVAEVSGVFSIIAVGIAAIGLCGILGYSVTRRRREIGVRIAVGAGPRTVEWLVVRESLILLCVGCAFGVSGAVLAARTTQSMLFGLTPADPETIAIALVVLALATIASAYVPARGATAVDPMVVLKSD